MKKRINEGYIYNYFSTLPSDLYRRFAKCFDFLLAPEIIDDNYINHCYVPCSLDEQLSEIYRNKIDGIYKLVGYTGIGKTTMICKNFGLIPNRSVPIINGKTLIMPVFFDGDKILETDVENKVIRKIKSVCTKIKKSLNLSLSKEEYENKLYEFIYDTKEELLEYEDNDIRYDDDERSKVSESIAALRKNNPNAYYLCELKMYLTLSEINNFIIVLDDLETQPIDIIMRIILEHLHIYECLKNSNRKYRIKLVMSSRPHTFRFLNDVEVYRSRLEAYGANELTIETPPDINEIFRKRFEYASNNLITNGEIRVTNVTSWQNALSVLKAINNNIDLEFDKILYEINHYNIRETLVCYIHILCNRQWFVFGNQKVQKKVSIYFAYLMYISADYAHFIHFVYRSIRLSRGFEHLFHVPIDNEPR